MTLRWAVVATVKAPLVAIRRFAAWHLELGADHVHIYLDDARTDQARALNAHPRITATPTDAAYWRAAGRRPQKHQVRQVHNATRAARTSTRDWLLHIDVDEFLLPDPAAGTVAAQLAALPDDPLCARLHAVEALAPGGGVAAGETAFKAAHRAPDRRRAAARACFGPWAEVLSGGFVSHLAGKMAVRPGAGPWALRIHNAVLDPAGAALQNPGEAALPGLPLGHFHAHDWEHFAALLDFRMAQGSYRAELRPPLRRPGAETLHTLLSRVMTEDGEAGLRRFFAEVCTASPALVARLAREGLLVTRTMDLDGAVQRQFGAA